MTDELDPTEVINQIIAQGRALVQAIAAMDTTAPSDRFERRQARLLQVEYRHRLREILRVVPAWVAEEILSAGQHIGGPTHFVDDLENDTCPKCGARLFHAIPNETTVQEIQEFHRLRGNNTDDPSWIHPGTFCTKCDWGILVEHVPPELAEMQDEDFPEYYDIRLIDAGPNRLALMQFLRQVCPMSPSEAKRRISQVPSVIGRVRWTQIEGLEKRFSQLGATVELEGVKE